MKFGDKGSRVKELQAWLISIGVLDSLEPYYGIKTREAVRTLQTALDVKSTGEYDDQLKSIYEYKDIFNDGMFYPTTYANKVNSEGNNSTYQKDFNENDADLRGLKFPCYIQNMLTGTTIKIPTTIEEVSWSKGNDFEEMATKGRSAPFMAYNGSTNKTLDISFTVHADYLIDEKRDLKKFCNKIEALAYPRYSSMIVPPKVFFRCGDVRLEGIVTDVSCSLKPPIINNRYTLADISISFVETYPVSKTAIDIEGGK